MTKTTATKIITFDCAHMLTKHDGKCANLHGHTYKLEVEISCYSDLIVSGPSKGMIMDFADLKAVLNQEVVEWFDHAFVYDNTYLEDSAENDILEVLVRPRCTHHHARISLTH